MGYHKCTVSTSSLGSQLNLFFYSKKIPIFVKINHMLKGFKDYNKTELFRIIDGINIYQSDNLVITKYFDRIMKSTPVSRLYEIFDIKSFLKSKIDQIEENFDISHYKLSIQGGVQHLTLLSDTVVINGTNYYKSFYILNSSDKSRRLNMNLGLYREDNGTYFVNAIRNMSLCKKHLRGVTAQAEEASSSIDGESFDEQIQSIQSLIGERVMLSEVQKIIVDKDLDVNHRKFDMFKNSLRYTDKSLTKSQLSVLMKPSDSLIINSSNDFSMDAYMVFNCYLNCFNKQDSYIVKKETEKISKITQCFIREEKLNILLEL